MVCSNPDRIAPSAGRLITAPGTVAAMYEQMGCSVLYVGKPHAPIYGACLDALEGLQPSEIVAIGDSIEHDVRGANGVAIDSCFVTGGIHAEEFPADATPAEREGRLADLSQRFGARPQWVVPRLVWSRPRARRRPAVPKDLWRCRTSEMVVEHQPAVHWFAEPSSVTGLSSASPTRRR